MFSIKEVANDLGITTQAIYNRKEELIEKSFLKQNEMGSFELSADGYNYLKSIRLNKIRKSTTSLKQERGKNLEDIEEDIKVSVNESITKLYEKRIEELKKSYEILLEEKEKQIECFKSLFLEEKNDRIKLNEQYQEMLLNIARNQEK